MALQVEALEYLKEIHHQQGVKSKSSIQLQGEDMGGAGKEMQATVYLEGNFPFNQVRGKSNLKSDSDMSKGASTRRTARTIAERARDSIFARLTEIAHEVNSLHEELCRPDSRDQLGLHPKDVVELRNICARTSAVCDAYRVSEPDLKEFGNCLRRIVENLLCSCTRCNSLTVTQARKRLREICDDFPDF